MKISLEIFEFFNVLEAVLMDTHNVCFGSIIRKLCIALQTPVFLYKMGFSGVYISRTCFPDQVIATLQHHIDTFIHGKGHH